MRNNYDTIMAILQTGILHLGPCIIIFLLTCGDSTDFTDKNIHTINRTAYQGDTVVFHCNGSVDKQVDVGWRKEEFTFYIYSPSINQSKINYTSSRMYVDPNNPLKLQISNVQRSDAGNYSCFLLKVQVQWILSIEVSEGKAELHREMLLHIVPSVTGALVVCFIIFCSVWIHRKWKTRSKEHRDELQQTQGGRMDRAQNSQYFERFNSLYGEATIGRLN